MFAIELARHAITVNAYAPGMTRTAMWDGLAKDLEELGVKDKNQSSDQYAADSTAMGRIGTPEDIANVVGGFLAGPNSGFVTGQTIVIDGGSVLI